MKTILIIIGVALVLLLLALIGYACIRLEASLQLRRQRRGARNGSMGA